jgi:phosphoglycolate/pyridoxal phosphate phosphatase family enzyme
MSRLIQELNGIKLAIFDLDGVIYRGNSLIKGVKQVIKDLKDLSIKVVYNSNNSTATRKNYVDRLESFNIECSVEDFYTSASIASAEITKLKTKSKIYIIGETGLQDELEARGHEIITEESRCLEVDFVVVGLDRNFTYQKLAIAQRCLLEGKAIFYATNADATLPAPTGLLPGAGVMVNAVQTCTNIKPEKVFGKPNPEGIELILREQEIAREKAVIFGDRLDTDIVAGNRAKIFTVMVLTGVTTEEMLLNIKKDTKENSSLLPRLVLNSLKEIFL